MLADMLIGSALIVTFWSLAWIANKPPKRNRRVRSIPPKAGFRDCNGPVRMRGAP